MGIERDPAELPAGPEAILTWLQAAFESGDAGSIALALDKAARARGVARDPLTADSDIASVIRTVKALGLQLTAKPT